MAVYGKNCVSEKSVKNEVLVLVQAANPRQGQAKTLIMAELMNKLDDLVRSDCHAILRLKAENVDVRVQTVWTIIHERLR